MPQGKKAKEKRKIIRKFLQKRIGQDSQRPSLPTKGKKKDAKP